MIQFTPLFVSPESLRYGGNMDILPLSQEIGLYCSHIPLFYLPPFIEQDWLYRGKLNMAQISYHFFICCLFQ